MLGKAPFTPVVKMVVKPVVKEKTGWTNSHCSFITVVKPCLSNRFDNRLDVCLHDTAGCQTGCIM